MNKKSKNTETYMQESGKAKRSYQFPNINIIIFICATILLSIIVYTVFALIPYFTGYSLITEGWDWLSYIGVIFGLLITGVGIILTMNKNNINNQKNRQLSTIPCLSIECGKSFDNKANNIFRSLVEAKGILVNTGLHRPREEDRVPNSFNTDGANFIISNKGFSTAFSVEVYIFKLVSIRGLDTLNQLWDETIPDFYDKITIDKYDYYSKAKLKKSEWLLAQPFNIDNINDSVSLVFDLSNIRGEYHSILEFRFQDIYNNKYYQRLYWYFDSRRCKNMPTSRIFSYN